MKNIVTIVLGLTLIFGFTSCGKSEKEVSEIVEELIKKKYESTGHNIYFSNGLYLKKVSGGGLIDDILGTGRSEYTCITTCDVDFQKVEVVINAVVDGGKVRWSLNPSARQQQIDAERQARQLQEWQRQQEIENQRALEKTQRDIQNYLNSQRDRDVDRRIEEVQREFQNMGFY